MILVIALIGRSNVGKSTLFNQLTKSRDALVSDFPGLTRDRKYGEAELLNRKFIIIDTAAIDNSEKWIGSDTTSQSLLAIKEADVIFFMVDAFSGVMPVEYTISQYLRSHKKNTYLLVNKVDGLDINIVLSDFYVLGIKNVFPIAACNGYGVSQVIKKIILSSSQLLAADTELLEEKSSTYWNVKKKRSVIKNNNKEKRSVYAHFPYIKLAIVGLPNVGKSTLINCILGEDRVIVCNFPGTTRDSIYIPMKRDGYEYILIDTAGVRKKRKVTGIVEKFSVIKTLRSIEDANVVLFVIDATQGVSNQDLSLLRFILNAGRSLVIVVNKWDSLTQKDRQSIRDMLDLRLDFVHFFKIHFISALYGNGVDALFNSIREAYESATRKIGASLLTRIMKIAEEKHRAPLVRGHRVKMKYAHVGGYNPPVVVIHGKYVIHLPDSYKRYLINYFRNTLQIMGTPIRMQFREGNNS